MRTLCRSLVFALCLTAFMLPAEDFPPLPRNRTWLSTNILQDLPAPAAPRGAQRQGHPRLFFGPDDVPALRERAEQEPFRSFLTAMRQFAFDETLEGNRWYNLAYRIRSMAFLHVITGEQHYADLTLEMVNQLMRGQDPDAAGVWFRVTERQLNLTQGSLSVAVAYDWCYHAWPEADRRRISRELLRQGRMQLHQWGPGFPSQGAANNWRGIRFAGGGIALLATDAPDLTAEELRAYRGDPLAPAAGIHGLDPRWLELAFSQVAAYLAHARTLEAGARGVNAEGFGYFLYPQTLIAPFLAAWDRMTGQAMRDWVPASAEGPVLKAMSTVVLPHTAAGTPHPHPGIRPDLSNDNPQVGNQGELAVSIPTLRPEHLGAYRWHFDHLHLRPGHENLLSLHAGLPFAYLFYPIDIPPESPEDVWGLSLHDVPTGTVVLRNRFQDENDVVFKVTARQRGVPRQVHHGAEVGSFRLIGEGGFFFTGSGRSSALAGQCILLRHEDLQGNDNRSAGELTVLRLDPQGTSHLRVTGSAASVRDAVRDLWINLHPDIPGVSAMLRVRDQSLDGHRWRINTPEFNRITREERGFTLHAPNGARLVAHIHTPQHYTLETGIFERPGQVHISDHTADNNLWLDIIHPQSDAPQFDVEFRLIPAGQ